ncbi:hypothetical protein BDW68DRAFT_169381, partial [Aspergillus falconensis]
MISLMVERVRRARGSAMQTTPATALLTALKVFLILSALGECPSDHFALPSPINSSVNNVPSINSYLPAKAQGVYGNTGN